LPIVTLPAEQRLGLVRALAISLVAHLLLFWPSTPAWRGAVVANPLQATLRPVLPPAIAIDTTEPTNSPIVPTSSARKRTEQKEILAPAQSLALAPTLLQGTATSDLTPKAMSRSASAQAALETSSASTAPTPVASLLDASEGVDPDGLRSYRLALARAAGRYKRYPVQAIEVGWAGTVEVRVIARADGVTRAAELAKSSGHAVLDEAALEMLRRALPTTPLPPTLQGQAFAISLPVLFELPD
jgi:periplasmic protein TonB